MSTPFRMKGWSPFTQKVDPGKTTPDQLEVVHEKKPLPNPKTKEFLEMFKKDDIESIEKKGKYTYDKDTKSWISTKTGKPVKKFLDAIGKNTTKTTIKKEK